MFFFLSMIFSAPTGEISPTSPDAGRPTGCNGFEIAEQSSLRQNSCANSSIEWLLSLPTRPYD